MLCSERGHPRSNSFRAKRSLNLGTTIDVEGVPEHLRPLHLAITSRRFRMALFILDGSNITGLLLEGVREVISQDTEDVEKKYDERAKNCVYFLQAFAKQGQT